MGHGAAAAAASHAGGRKLKMLLSIFSRAAVSAVTEGSLAAKSRRISFDHTNLIQDLKEHPNGSNFEPLGNPRLVPFLDCQKNAIIPAIRALATNALTMKMADFRDFLEVSA